ncbi:HNH endonuclease [Flavobacterium ovatum]|uniref:HNH endonuclease n=1 Tax=Flavobacterium ovatum TaxID=1928857 RepID=UPI00344BD0A9
MLTKFQINDPSIESQWRAIILFGKNSATYKFAFAKALLETIEKEKTKISLEELSIPFANSIVDHLQKSDKQGNSVTSTFLEGCRGFIKGDMKPEDLYRLTEKYGFVNVIDAFQNVNGGAVSNTFYEKNFIGGKKEIVITDNLLKIKELFQYRNLNQEVEARWNLVETAWNLKINPNLLEVNYDEEKSLFFIESNVMQRIDITSVRDALNGYQKGKCFYSLQDISINKNNLNICQVDHFLPHINKKEHCKNGANINGVWNLVLADSNVNLNKSAKIPDVRFLERLYDRNEYYIESKHPLAETIINQTGLTKKQRRNFLQFQYNLALSLSIQRWRPEFELI